jgi:YbgC/YbaW family acyl-CoA thioester hydrolase
LETSSKPSRWSEYTLRRRVLFYELDSAGIVHFSWYFRYMEEAEHALWREAGLSIAPPGSEVGFPRVAASFEYQRPLKFEEEFEVHIRVEALGEKSIRYGAVLTRGDTTIATGTTTVVCVRTRPNESMKAIPIPPEIAAKFEVAAGHRP